MKSRFLLQKFFPLAFITFGGVTFGADIWWSGATDSNWANAGNWSSSSVSHIPSSSVPGAADNAYFSTQTVTGDVAFSLGANISARSLNFQSAGATSFVGSGTSRILTIGGSGVDITPTTSTIDIASGAGPVTIGIGNDINGISTRIQASQTWTNNSSNLFTVHNSIQPSVAGAFTLTIAGSGDTLLGTTRGLGNGASDGTRTLSLTKTGTGTLTTFSGSDYTGVTRIEGGTLVASSIKNGGESSSIGASSSDSSNLVFNGGTLHWTGSSNTLTDRGFTVEAGGGAIRNNTSGMTLRFSGIVAGTGDLEKLGNGSLSFSNTLNSFSGRLLVRGGGLSIRTEGALGVGGTYASGTEVFSGANLDLDPNAVGGSFADTTWNEYLTLHGGSLTNRTKNNTWTGAITLTATSSVATTGDSSLTVSGVIGGTGGLTKTQSGTLFLKAANTYSGPTTINAGTLRIDVLADGGSASGLGSSSAAAANLVFNGGSLFVNNPDNVGTNRGFTLGENGGTIRKDSNIVRFGGVITGAGDLRKTGGGVLALSNNGNNFTGRIVVDAGSVEARSAGSLGASGSVSNGVVVNSGAILRLDPNGTNGANANVTWNETVTLNGGAIWNRSRNNTWNGGMILGADSRIAADASTSLTINSSVTEEGAGRSLSMTGNGTITFTSVNAFTGSTIVAAGTVVATATGGFNSSTQLSLDGGTFRLGANEVFNDLASLAFGGGVLDMNHYNETIGGAVTVSLDSSIAMSGNSVLRLGASSDETWLGILSISGWNGLALGGGDDQIFFGADDTALTTEQRSRINFIDPAGYAPGTYDALMLATGEIVPGLLIPEPTSFLLVALGATGLTLRRRR
jgi:fibronectin-binding autotransporter adhesin